MTENIMQQWNALDTMQQINLITANVKKAAREEVAAYAALFLEQHQIDAFINEAWIKLAERLNVEYLDKLNAKRRAAGKADISLLSLVYRAAKDAIRTAQRDDRRHQRCRVEITGEDGEPLDRLETIASIGRNAAMEDVTFWLALEQFTSSRDKIDRIIIECKSNSLTEREIAETVGMTCAAVHKRIVKIRQALIVYVA